MLADGVESFDYVVDVRAGLSKQRAWLINIERDVVKPVRASVDTDSCTLHVPTQYVCTPAARPGSNGLIDPDADL